MIVCSIWVCVAHTNLRAKERAGPSDHEEREAHAVPVTSDQIPSGGCQVLLSEALPIAEFFCQGLRPSVGKATRTRRAH
jgi:hypothetical protein